MIEPAFVHELRGYFAILHKRRTLVATCVVVSMIVAMLYNYTTRPLYQATAQIRIDRESPDILPSKELMRIPITPDYLLTEYQLLAGRELAERVVEQLQLQKSEEFLTGPLVTPWERLQKFLGRNPATLTDSDGIPLSPAIAAFRSRLTIEPITGSRLVNIRFTAYNPQVAAAAANTVAEAYIVQSQELRSNTSNEATGWLSDRVKEQQATLAKAEHALQEYREREGILTVDEKQEVAGQRTSTITAAILTARTQRIAKESLLAQVRALSPSQLPTSSVVANLPGVAALRLQRAELLREQARLAETLGERHPEMVRNRTEIQALDDKIAAEIDTAIRTIEAEAQTAREQESVLQASLEMAKRESFDLNRKSSQYGMLKREVDSNQEILRGLLTRSKQSGLEGELTHSNIRVVEKADIPRAPLWPQKTRNYELALLMGLALGIGLCLFFEHLDNTFKTPDDVKQYLGLPFLGMVPDVSQRSRGANAPRPSPLILRSPKSAVAEAYRVLRTNLIFSTADRTGHVLAISSANPGEGKTTTVANLAASLAINGSRVLAVDADLRRPTMHQHFGLAKTPGLSDLIVGKCRPSEAIHKTQFGGLQVLPCGYVPPNPTELLGSASLREIIAALRTHYDWILIDTPPILAMADTAVLCPLVDGVAIVVGAEQSTRPAVQRSVDQIKSVNGRMLGVILNKVNFERNSYYYGQYYGEYYRSYYAEKQDESRTGRAAGSRPLRRM